MRFFGENKLETGQVTVDTTAIKVVSKRTNRRSLLIVQHGTNAVYLGKDKDVSSTTGVLLNGTAGIGMAIPVTGEVWAISGAAQVVSFIEIYND